MVSDLTAATGGAAGRALRVLLIEDDAMLGMLFADLLETLGHSVCAVAATEEEAVSLAGLREHDLIIADANLAQGSGISAVERILKTRATPHIFMSGNIAKFGAAAPGAIMLEKPFAERDLRHAIALALDLVAAP